MLSAFCFHKKIALKGELDANYERTILDSKTQVRNVVLKMTFACSRDRKKFCYIGYSCYLSVLSYEKSLKALGLFSLEKALVDLIPVYKDLMRRDEEGTGLFPKVPTDRTRGNGHKLKLIKFHLNTEKTLLNCEHAQTLEEVVQRDCPAYILGDFQNLT